MGAVRGAAMPKGVIDFIIIRMSKKNLEHHLRLMGECLSSNIYLNFKFLLGKPLSIKNFGLKPPQMKYISRVYRAVVLLSKQCELVGFRAKSGEVISGNLC